LTTRLEAASAVDLLGALAQSTRLEIFRLLMRYRPHGLAAGDIGRLLAVPHNTLSTHLGALEQVGLLASRREGRHIIFAAVPDRADALLGFLSEACCSQSLPACETPATPYLSRREIQATDTPLRVLIVCTGNSARSIMAEAVMNREGLGRIQAYSAGSRPHEAPHPLALQLLRELGYATADFRSKSWDEFLAADAPEIDLVITVCDSAADEACPSFPGAPMRVHWGLDDPAEVGGPVEARRAAFRKSYRDLTARVTALVNLPLESMTLAELAPALEAIGRMDGATPRSLEAA
jgi:protein-tyrosine-phosphatase/DNA-binding transcriptional ArsR family regulator